MNAGLDALYAFVSAEILAALLLAWLAHKGLLRGTVSIGRPRHKPPVQTGERM